MSYCVYKHTCPNGKMYIGITSKNPLQRWANGKGYKENEHFTNAIIKYGWDNITHEIIYSDLDKEQACQKEIELISKYNTTDRRYGYNKSTGGEHGGLGCIHTEEQKEKMRKAMTGRVLSEEHKRKIGDGNRGKKLSEETRKRLSEKRKGKKQPDGWGEKHSKSIYDEKNGRSVKVICIETGEIFTCAKRAAEKYNTNNSSILKACKGVYKTSAGLHWSVVYEQDNKIL